MAPLGVDRPVFSAPFRGLEAGHGPHDVGDVIGRATSAVLRTWILVGDLQVQEQLLL